MELLQLNYFKTVAEKGKISSAAEALFLSPPALSTSISRLEKELGVPLFDRTGNRILLNRQGTIFLRHVNQIFEELDTAKEELHQSLLQESRNISVATVSSTQWIDLISAFSQAYPEISLSCTSLKISQLSKNGLPAQYTFLLASADAIPTFCNSELDNLPLFQDHPVIVVHKTHPLAQRESVELNELLGETLFLPMPDYSLHGHLVALFESSGIPFPAGNAYPHLVCQHMAAAKLGISFASSHTAMIPSSDLCYVPIKTTCPTWTAHLYWKKSRKLTRNEQLFRAFAQTYYQKGKLL